LRPFRLSTEQRFWSVKVARQTAEPDGAPTSACWSRLSDESPSEGENGDPGGDLLPKAISAEWVLRWIIVVAAFIARWYGRP
jgi:hypothetical protein